MVGSMGFLYAALFHMDLHDYLPFLALSIVLWNFVSGMVGEACTTFTGAEGMIRSVRMPFLLYAARVVLRKKEYFSRPATKELLDEMAKEVDVAISALGG
jgi:lipopolysaccharide transport system permease protein